MIQMGNFLSHMSKNKSQYGIKPHNVSYTISPSPSGGNLFTKYHNSLPNHERPGITCQQHSCKTPV